MTETFALQVNGCAWETLVFLDTTFKLVDDAVLLYKSDTMINGEKVT